MSTPQTTHWDGCATDGGPAHYWCAVGRIRELEAELARAREERDALLATLNRLPPYDADGFYIDHGEHGKQPVSVADVMDSLRGAIAARVEEKQA